jgi:hypothetical protein
VRKIFSNILIRTGFQGIAGIAVPFVAPGEIITKISFASSWRFVERRSKNLIIE